MSDCFQSALDSLPHGPEFRFIDEILALQPGQCATAVYHVRGSEPFLAGHFPGAPLFPGVLLIEGGAQLAGIVAQSDPLRSGKGSLRLAAVRAVKILESAKPGETIEFEARLVRRLGNVTHAEIAARVGSRCLLNGEVTLSTSAK
jgi:3-hydroxyacyl-[acyl-carrier-protein] dehydratase